MSLSRTIASPFVSPLPWEAQGAPAPQASMLSVFGAKVMSWHRGDLGVTLAGSGVGAWADQSGNGRDYSQATDARRPSVTTWAGRPAIGFAAASNHYLTLTGTSYGSPSALHVIRFVSINNDPPAGSPAGGLDGFGAFAGAQMEFPYTDGNIYDATGANSRANVGNPATSLTGTVVYESTSTASAFKAKVNGASLYSGGTLGVGVRAVPEIGGDTRSVRYLDGKLAEVVVLNAEPSAAERTAMAAYALARYGLVIV